MLEFSHTVYPTLNNDIWQRIWRTELWTSHFHAGAEQLSYVPSPWKMIFMEQYLFDHWEDLFSHYLRVLPCAKQRYYYILQLATYSTGTETLEGTACCFRKNRYIWVTQTRVWISDSSHNSSVMTLHFSENIQDGIYLGVVLWYAEP